jgi:hypothetical protein
VQRRRPESNRRYLEGRRQRLTLVEKTGHGVRRRILAELLYVSPQGEYGVRSDQPARVIA